MSMEDVGEQPAAPGIAEVIAMLTAMNAKMDGIQQNLGEKVGQVVEAQKNTDQKLRDLETKCDRALGGLGTLQRKVASLESANAKLSESRASAESERETEKEDNAPKQRKVGSQGERKVGGGGSETEGAKAGPARGAGGGVRFPPSGGRAASSWEDVRVQGSGTQGSETGGTGGTGDQEVTNPKKIWVKGFGRKMMGEVLREQGHKYVAAVNDTLVLGEPKFVARVYGLNGDMSTGLLFETAEEATAFFLASRDVKLPFDDSKGGEVVLRAVRDSTFSQRLRGQVYWNLREEATRVLSQKVQWNQWKDAMEIASAGPRGAVVLSNGVECWEIFKVDVAKRATTGFVKPCYEALSEWGASKEEADEIVRVAMSKSSLRLRIR